MEDHHFTPDRPVSSGANGYHNAVCSADYYLDNLKELTRIAKERVKDGDIVVDFGAGTGVSAISLVNDIKVNFKLWLVDNSAAWLAKAYEIFKGNPKVELYLLEKMNDAYQTLAETIGATKADHVISANTVHLIPDIDDAFKGINSALKPSGSFTFQSGSIVRDGRDSDILMFDQTVNRVHDLALDVIRSQEEFASYREHLQERIDAEQTQRKFVFPNPRNLEEYMKKLKEAGFNQISTCTKLIRIKYEDWINFLKVRRLQAGILPEVGGRKPTEQEEKDRDKIIGLAADKLFSELAENNSKADKSGFTCEWVYVTAIK